MMHDCLLETYLATLDHGLPSQPSYWRRGAKQTPELRLTPPGPRRASDKAPARAWRPQLCSVPAAPAGVRPADSIGGGRLQRRGGQRPGGQGLLVPVGSADLVRHWPWRQLTTRVRGSPVLESVGWLKKDAGWPDHGLA